MIGNIKIEHDKEKPWIHRTFINGMEIDRVNHIDINIDSDSLSEVNIGIDARCDFAGIANIRCD